MKKQIIVPRLLRVHQKFNTDRISDIPARVREELDKLNLDVAGKRIAITAGSRGISKIDVILRTAADWIRSKNGIPFLVPAMGSHGGANAEGQLDVLKGYNITEETMGCPILSSMDTVELGKTANGATVYFDRNAYESDGVLVINRVKPHTDFLAEHESGLCKMVAVGLGKERGCSQMHSFGLAETIPQSCEISLKKAPILAGLAIVENSKDETHTIEGVPKEHFMDRDAALLKLSKSLVPSLPADHLDVLIVKEIGKMYSGTGMDTKVIGRIRVRGVPEPETPDIKTIAALRMNEHSYGNAIGIGLADITTEKLVRQIDRKSMYSNLLATTFLERGKIPVYFHTEKEAIRQAFLAAAGGAPNDIAIVENTLHIENLIVSESVYEKRKDSLDVLENDLRMEFDDDGNLLI
ncbi:MAG: lactate racemase domain-containing protein [Eubacteriales bacterium]|nr:lactate racemase domain-containing protein [Eubacteriales bacterium]